MEQRLDISRATAKRDIDILKNAGLIEYVGSRKAGRYMLTEKGTGIMSSK
jgi:Mn-dependent DtxR family transcriptional regulator